MENLSSTPNGEDKVNAKWQKWYILAEHWKTDLLFYRDDLKFLHDLMDKYFIWITKKEDLKKVSKTAQNILNDKRECEELLEKVEKHISHLSKIIDNSFKDNGEILRSEHKALEDEIALFIKKVRKNRTQVFSVTEYLLDNEKLEYLIRD